MDNAKGKALNKKIHGDEGIREALGNTRKALGMKKKIKLPEWRDHEKDPEYLKKAYKHDRDDS
jgi:hypothetical protein